MITIAIEDAKKDLAQLISRAKAGEEVVITLDDHPIAKLVPLSQARTPRTPGRLKGKLDLPDAFFFDPLPEEDLKAWSGSYDPKS